MPLYRTRFAIFLISLAAIGLELAIMRALSLRFWHHFAYMVISAALLGFGASGTAIMLLRRRIKKNPQIWLCALALTFSLSVPVSVILGQYVPLNVQHLAWGFSKELLNIIVIELLMFLPFLFAGAAVGIALMDSPGRISGHYAVNLVGSGVGAAASIALMHMLSTGGLFIVMSALGYAAGVVLVPRKRISAAIAAAAIGALIILLNLLAPAQPLMSQYKMLSQTKAMPETKIIYHTEGPLGRIDVVSGPAIHYAPGLSLQFNTTIPAHVLLTVDGDLASAVYDCDLAANWEFLDHTTAAAAYHLRKKPRTLIVGAGGGADIGLALFHNSLEVVALELNRQIIETMTGPLLERGGSIYTAPGTKIVNKEARGYFLGVKDKFDIIQLPSIGAFGASGAGLYSAQESYLYTVESFQLMLECLNDTGLLSVTRWMRTPPRDGIKVIDIAITALRRMGREPSQHLAVIRSWVTINVIVSAGPITTDEKYLIKRFCKERGFDLGYLPGLKRSETNRFHVLDRPYYYEAAQALLGPQRDKYIADYLFKISAPTDDKPYFFNFFRWSSLPALTEQLGGQSPAFVELGYLLLTAALLQSIVAGAVLIVLPLVPGIRSIATLKGKAVVLGYFLFLGIGFMMIEICFLQKLILYLAHPIYSAAVVIASFLVFGGLGSMISGYWLRKNKNIYIFAAGTVIIIALVYLCILSWWLEITQTQPMAFRFLIAAAAIAPLALAMGHMFPTGLRQVGQTIPALVPWSWAVNGFASVAAAVATPLVAMAIGFSYVTLIAIMCYALAGTLSQLLPSRSQRGKAAVDFSRRRQ